MNCGPVPADGRIKLAMQCLLGQSKQVAAVSSPRLRRAGVCALLVIMLVIDVTSISLKTPTHDEETHCRYGWQILHGNSDRFDDSKMPVSVLNVLPLAVSRLLPPGGPKALLANLAAARLVTIAFSIVLALYVFRWTEDLYGTSSAFLALGLYTFSPTVIAHSRLTTTDLYAACSIYAATYYLWRLCNVGGWKRGIAAAVAFGVSQITKYTAAYLVPIFLLVVGGRYFTPVANAIHERDRSYLARVLKDALKHTLPFAFASTLIINAAFLFNRPFTKFGNYTFRSDLFRGLQSCPVLSRIPVPLPYPYVEGLDWSLYSERTGAGYGRVYLLGQLRDGRGFKTYYAVAFLFKVPIAIQLLALWAAVYTVRRRKQFPFWRDEAFLVVPIVFFAAYFSLFYRTQLGIRFILVIFPFLFTFCGKLAAGWWGLRRKRRLAIAGLMAYLVISNLSYYPHYLPYFNEFLLDRKQAYRILADSNIDWGQNYYYLRQYMKRHPGCHVHPQAPVAGRIIVRVNELVGITATGPERYRWLRENFEPVDHIGYSYLVYDVSPEALGKLGSFGVHPAPCRLGRILR